MFRFFVRKPVKKMSAANEQQKTEPSNQIYSAIQDNVDHIKKTLNSPSDLLVRIFKIGDSRHRCAIVCIDGIVNVDMINGRIIQQIQLGMSTARKEVPSESMDIIVELEEEILATHDIKRGRTFDDIFLAILSGDTALFVEGADQAILLGSKMWEGRKVDEPATESLVRGPREGFTENVRTNTMLIRRSIRDPNLQFDGYKLGRRSKKDLLLCYINGIVHPDLVQEVKSRVDTIDIDDAPESGYVEQWIEDSFLSPFPQILHTERPDKVSSALLQGKVALVLDGTPFVLVMPTSFVSLIQSPEDYYERWLIGSLIRVLRYIAVFISVFLPALYIALVSYHQGMIPSKLAFSIAAARDGVPFPAFIEAVLMETTLELLREAGIRLPKPIGQTIGIVGGLVIGEAAVQAGFVSPIMVIVVAITAIASFAIPSYSAGIAFRILRFGTMAAASIFGLYGIILTYIMINLHMVRLKSFGIPYTTPFSPTFMHDWRDLFIRMPLHMLGKRPQYMQTEDEQRIGKRGDDS